MNVGDKVTYKNGEICTIKEIKSHEASYITTKKGRSYQSTAGTSYILAFEDGEITIAGLSDFSKAQEN